MQSEASSDLSVALFGNRYFARVLASVIRLERDNELVSTRRVARLLEASDSVVRPVRLRMVEARLLVALPRVSGPRSPQYYAINNPTAMSALFEATAAASAT